MTSYHLPRGPLIWRTIFCALVASPGIWLLLYGSSSYTTISWLIIGSALFGWYVLVYHQWMYSVRVDHDGMMIGSRFFSWEHIGPIETESIGDRQRIRICLKNARRTRNVFIGDDIHGFDELSERLALRS